MLAFPTFILFWIIFHGSSTSKTINYHDADVAEEILNKCTMNDPGYPNPDDEDYSVAFCYEFLEDARDKEQRYKQQRFDIQLL